jgi:hypothetical protein
MGIGRLVSGLMASGQLVAPFCERTIGSRAYFVIRSRLTGNRPQVRAFADWLTQEAKTALAAEDKAALAAKNKAHPETARPTNTGAARSPGK